MGNFIFKVLVIKQNQKTNDSFFETNREYFECYLSTSDEVCELIHNLSDWLLSYSVEKIVISDSSVYSQILDKFNLKG